MRLAKDGSFDTLITDSGLKVPVTNPLTEIPAKGSLIYNTNTNTIFYGNGTSFQSIGGSPIGTPLNSAQILVGDALNTAQPVTISGDGTLSNTGVLTTTVSMYKLNFAWDTPNLNTGIDITTMNPGDILLDAWVISSEDFDGTTPRWDLGTYNPLGANPDEGILRQWAQEGYLPAVYEDQVDYMLSYDPKTSISSCFISNVSPSNGGDGNVYTWQTKFLTTSILKFVCSQTGTQGGPPIGGTTGQATLYVQISRA